MQVVRAVGLVGGVLLFGRVAYALFNQPFSFGVQRQFNAQRPGRALARVVVWCGTDAASAKHHITRRTAGGKGARQRCGDARRVVADIVGIRQRQASGGQQFDDFRQMLVSTFSRENFIADDDESKIGGHSG